MRLSASLILISILLIMITSCGTPAALPADGYTFTDALGREVSISPSDSVAACHASFADCWLLAGGQLVGATSDAVEDHGLDIGGAEIIGTAKSISAEAISASGASVALLSADLTAHLEINDMLEGLGIRCIYLRSDTFGDYAQIMRHFCNITGREDLYYTSVTLVQERIEAILKKAPDNESRTVLLMRAYSSGIKAKSGDNPAGLILGEFGLNNIADEHPSLLEDMSLEHITASDPDFIFVLTMGSEEAAVSYLERNIESNPAFSELTAVKNGHYHILPKELFHYKANERWDESYEYIAEILYPGITTES